MVPSGTIFILPKKGDTMIEMLLMALKDDRVLPQPTGQITFNVGGPHVFTVPDDVTRVSVACLGAALKVTLPFPYTPYQAGGAIVYMNDIPVTPGQKIDINVGIPGYENSVADYTHSRFSRFQSMAASYYDAMRIPTGAVGRWGGRGGYTNRSGLIYTGGSAAKLTGAGLSGINEVGSSQYSTARKPGGWNSDLTIYTEASTATLPNAYGRGADLQGGVTYLQQPTGGIVRIIWGNDRGFPDRNIGNMEERTLEEVLADK